MEIRCNYRYEHWPRLGFLYTCNIFSASITEPNQELKAIIGHDVRKKNRDVAAILFSNNEVRYMPRGIVKIFPNLKAIAIHSCRLKKITWEDLVGLENIEVLSFYDNELTSLSDNLFEGMKKLRVIIFSGNKLEFVSSQLLQPVLGNQLTLVGFWSNPTINASFDASIVNPSGFHVDLPVLMKLIDEKCKKPPKVKIQIEQSKSNKSWETFKNNFMQGFNDLWTSGQFSDFTIVVEDRKFQVYKTVLTFQSEFFAETFKKAEDNSVTEFKVEDSSAEAVEEVLRWIYTGKIPDVKNALEVFTLVMKLKISGLKEIAENLVSLKLDKKNAMEVFELGHRYSSEKLKNLAFEEIKKFLAQPDLNENLKNEPVSLKKIVEAKKNFELVFKKFNK